MRNDKKKENKNVPLEPEKNFRIRTVTPALGFGEGDDSEFDPSRMHSYEVTKHFGTDISTGLDEYAVKSARRKYGTNELFAYMKLSFFHSMRTQLSGLIGLLLALMCLVMYMFNGSLIYVCFTAFIVLNAVFNASLEHISSSSLETVMKSSSMRATVFRSGKSRIADSRALVPGDIIILERGTVVPADARLLESNKLTVLETPLTGNAEPTFKNSIYINRRRENKFSRNMVYGGTIVTSGSGTAIVTATGRSLLIRAGERKNKERRPRLLEYVFQTSRRVMLSAIIFCFCAVFVGALCNADIVELFMLSLASCYVTMTDTLGSLCTAVLVSGTASMIADGAAVKNLDCIQPLCEIDTIMCDSSNAFPVKRMRVESAFAGFHRYTVTRNNREGIGRLLAYSLACSDVKLEYTTQKDRKKRKPHYVGTKKDIALARACREMGISLDAVREVFFRIESEYGADNELTRALVLNEGKTLVIEKGAPEEMLRRCTTYEQSGAAFPLVENARNRFLDEAQDLADKSQHVMALAFKTVKCDNLAAVETNDGLTFIGLLGLYTSIELNAASAVYQCNRASITPLVRTDAPYATAVALARNAGIIANEQQAVTGEDILSAEPGLYIADSPNYRLFINVSREQWEQVERIRLNNGAHIAFEALSLDDLEQMAAADVSFVPADAGSETLRQCADVVLRRDGFNVITALMCKARLIYRRIHSALQFSIVAFAAYATAIIFCTLTGMPIPFGIQHILLCGGIVNIAVMLSLAYAPTRRRILSEKLPSYGKKPKFTDLITPLLYGMGAAAIMIISYTLGASGSAQCALSMSFVSMNASLVLYSFVDLKSEGSLGSGAWKNALIPVSALCTAALTALMLYTKTARSFFGFTYLSWKHILLCVVLSATELLILYGVRMVLSLINTRRSEKRRERLFGPGGDEEDENAFDDDDEAKEPSDAAERAANIDFITNDEDSENNTDEDK